MATTFLTATNTTTCPHPQEEQKPQHQPDHAVEIGHVNAAAEAYQKSEGAEEPSRHAIQATARRHALSTAALCTCTFIQAYLLISVFPYAGYMVIDLMPPGSVDEESAGSYAGLIASSFMFGRTFSAYQWGKLADVYGRKPVLVSSLILSAVFSIMFGLAKTFWFAMASRFLLGFSNGIQGTAKTAVTEIAYGDEKLEARGTGIAIGMRGVGFLLSPAIGGILAEPVRQFPSSGIVKQFGPLLARFPFLLPNIVGAFLCGLSALAVVMFVEETLPDDKRRDTRYVCGDTSAWFRNNIKTYRPCQTKDMLNISAEEEQHLMPSKPPTGDKDEATMALIWRRKSTRKHLIAYWLFSFVVACVDEAFPLYCISKDGGLALSEASIGTILSAAGLFFVLGQYYTFATLVDRCGLYQSLTIETLLGVPLMALIPVANVLNVGAPEGQVKGTTLAFLALLIGIGKIFACNFFAGITIATNRTVPASLRATTNGLSMVGGSIFKGLGPTFAGLLCGFAFSSGFLNPKYGAMLVWSVIGLLGLVVVVDISTLPDFRESYPYTT